MATEAPTSESSVREPASSTQADVSSSTRRVARRMIAPLILLVVTAAVYEAIYFREQSIPTAIGAHLVPAERVLKGEIPYRGFYKIQTPGILLLNAALFRVWRTSLLTAMTGVLAFRVLTVVLVFVIARRVSSWKAALVAAALALLWLAPGGPFRPAPIQYERPFVLVAIYFTLRWLDSSNARDVLAAGLAVGIVSVFKQNVGVYAAVALTLSILFNKSALPSSIREAKQFFYHSLRTNGKALAWAALGAGVPLIGLVAYLWSNHALRAAIGVFLRGPGEHLQSRFTGYPLPKHAAVIFIAGALGLLLCAELARRLPRLRSLTLAFTLLLAVVGAAFVPQSAIDNSIFWFAPILFAFAAWHYVRATPGGEADRGRGMLLVLLLFSVAAFGEVFPRSVRGLVIDTMAPAFVLFACLLSRISKRSAPSRQLLGRLTFAAASIVLIVFALRLDVSSYCAFDRQRGLRFRADTELNFDRGRGIYLPAARAEEVNATVATIRSRVEDGGYFFAHSVDASSYYFLADRNSPTGATLWNDTGTNDAERARTMIALKEKDVRLVLTSEQAMKAETYKPLLDLLNDDFHPISAGEVPLTIGKTIFLERNY